jgi:short-subunit dehydrogenase
MTMEHAIVTGAASGIGREAVRRWVVRGAQVTAADRDEDKLAQLYADEPRVQTVAGDVTDPAFADAVVAKAEALGPVTQLFHSAGIMPGGEIADVDAEGILRVMEVNYFGTVRIVKAVLPVMRSRREGTIVVMGSVTGYVPTPKFSAYCASKAAVNSFTEILAAEEKPNGIRVLLVAPNAVKTPLLKQAVGGPSAIAKVDAGKLPMMGLTPADVLDAVENALHKSQRVVLPGARAFYALRRLSPAGMAAIASRLGG